MVGPYRKIFIKPGDAGKFGAFEIQGQAAACPFLDELVEEVMVCFVPAAGGWGGRLQQIKTVLIAQQQGGGQDLAAGCGGSPQDELIAGAAKPAKGCKPGIVVGSHVRGPGAVFRAIAFEGKVEIG